MKLGRIGPGIKLPGTRLMSETIDVHRKTIVRAYEELDAQGWIEMRPSQGTFTSKELPEVVPRKLAGREEQQHSFPAATGYSVKINSNIRKPVATYRHITGFHDGPDVRLMPSDELAGPTAAFFREISISNTCLMSIRRVFKNSDRFSPTISTPAADFRRRIENILTTRGQPDGTLFLLSHVLFSKRAIWSS